MENPEQRRFSVIAGVKEEGDALGFVQKLQSFVKPDPIDLLLVHAVTEKAKVPSFYKELLGKFDITELDNRQLPDGEMKRALARQQQLTGQLGKEPNTQVRLAFADDAATALIDEAQRVGSSLIAVEVEQHLYQFIPGGLSVALSLMLFSPVPVLLIRRESKNNFAQREHSLIIADDLSSASLSAVRKGLEMAAKWGHTHVIHVHAIDRSLHTTLKDLAEISKKVDAGFLATPKLFFFTGKADGRYSARSRPACFAAVEFVGMHL